MTINEVLTLIKKLDVRLAVQGQELVVTGTHDSLTPAVIDALRAHKAPIMTFLSSENSVDIHPGFPLVTLTEEEIDRIEGQISGGASNIQDIYPLAPLQEGILFHHLMDEEGDPYLLSMLGRFQNRQHLDQYLEAMQAVVNRHDILRTAIVWEGVAEPVQVVQRKAALYIEEVSFDSRDGDVVEQLYERFNPRHYRIRIDRAPLLHLRIAQDERGQWLMMQLLHHLVIDHDAMHVMRQEIQAYLEGRGEELAAPPRFRDLVAQARLGMGKEEHEDFFRAMLGDVEEPTAPFGLIDVQRSGRDTREARLLLEPKLSVRLRECARRLKVSVASLFHLVWGQVIARTSGQRDVVFGTVLFGRMQGGVGSDRGMGLFINTLPIRVQLGQTPLVESVQELHLLLAELIRHEHATLALAQRCSRIAAPAPLFSCLLNYRHGRSVKQGTANSAQAQQGIEWLRSEERTNYPLTLSVDDLDDAFYLTAQVQEPVDPARICGYVWTALDELVEALDKTPLSPVERLEILPAAEREQVLYGWNDTSTEFPSELCIHQLFEEQVARTPEATAVLYDDRRLTYGELNERSNRLAHHLIGLGVGPDTRVAICVERGFEMIEALLAVLKAGGAYVPLDPSYPEDRLHFMLQDSGPLVLLTQGHLRKLFAALVVDIPVLELDDARPAWNGNSTENPILGQGLGSRNLAYIIYTSGSTGTPKGVMVEHRNATNFIHWATSAFDYKELAHTMFSTSLNFDLAVFELYVPLSKGTEVCLVSDVLDSRVDHSQISLINTVPSAMKALLESARTLTSIRTVNLAGEPLKPALAKAIFQETSAHTLCNLYGPSETTTYSTWVSMARTDGFAPHIGRPISNTQIYILDGSGSPVPVGVVGELHIGGVGVARGYLNRPELTAERFVVDPFAKQPGARMYKTGDLGRWLSDGTIEYLGRNDFQVKIRGFRIELGEIEARLAEHPGVRDAVVIAREDTPGDKRLVAYYTSSADVSDNGAEAFRSHLSATLPDYMVPAAYVYLDALPLTPNGKLDRKALPAPEGDAYSTRSYEPPQGETETILAAVWADVLKLEQVGRHDNFFDLGGHSLLAVRVITRLRRSLNVEVSLNTLFAHPVLLDCARSIELISTAALPAITVQPRPEHLPLSFAQQRLWFLAQMEGVSRAYHVPFGLQLEGDLDYEALQQSLDAIMMRHESLRTSFRAMDGVPVQIISPAGRLSLQVHDLRSAEDADLQVKNLAELEAETVFDLEHGPVIRGRLIRQAEHRHILLITMHHIVSDGWSIGLLTRELGSLYGALHEGRAASLPALAVQYADYALWQRQWIDGEVLRSQAAFWQKNLEGAPALLELPSDHPRPSEQNYAGSTVRVVLEPKLTQGLKQLSQRHGTTLFMTLLAAWSVLLSRLSGQMDLVIGTPTANRNRAEIEELIGFFVNTLALRIDLSGSPTVAEMLERVKSQALSAQQHQDIPFEQVVELAKPVRSLSHSPLFQVMFAWQNAPRAALEMSGLQVRSASLSSHTVAKFDLTLSMFEVGDMIAGGLEYATALFERATIERFLTYFETLLTSMVADDQQRIERLEILPAAEREQVLYGWNDTSTEFPSELCIHQLFEEQVARTPEATAVLYDDRRLTYGELNERSNRLAHHLIGLGVGPDTRVAICVERGFEMIEALLAVLKAGGAYVPLDPSYPEDRLHFMLQDSGPLVLLTQGHLRKLFAALVVDIPVLELDDARPAWNGNSTENPILGQGLGSRNLAYIIYTSGSTGTPKGVMVEHRNATNFIHWATSAFDYKELARTMFSTSLNFDLAVFELYVPLSKGTEVCLVSDVLDSRVDHSQISLINTVPSAMKALLESARTLTSIRTVNLAGEPLKPALAKAIFQETSAHTLCNLYGPSETTTYSTWVSMARTDGFAPHIGRPISNTQIYILDGSGSPVPVGVVGELHIGGAGVARGYLNRPELTAERFVVDPFAKQPGARMYKTGDLGRWLSDGTIEYLGRNDFQVKIRGFRIELGEIEARLAEHPGVRDAVVIAREDTPGDKRLVAYYTSSADVSENGAEAFRSHLSATLPDYMVPAAYVYLDALPLTPNGKLDRKALPAPEGDAYSTRSYEPPQGETETILAAVWADVLKLEQVGRHDNFFDLGGHSLLAVRVIERVRRAGWQLDVRALFATANLAALALSIDLNDKGFAIPVNLIPESCDRIEPSMLPLVTLTEEEIDRIEGQISGGASNIQDIYPLAPLQEGILFHHLMDEEGDPYLLSMLGRFQNRQHLDQYLEAMQAVVNRHDILRTAIVWEGVAEPVQVVQRKAALYIEEVSFDSRDGDVVEQLYERFNPRHYRIRIDRAPLLHLRIAQDERGQWLMMQLLHHLVIDHDAMHVMRQEIQAYLEGRGEELAAPPRFRDLVAQARLGMGKEEHEDFFRAMLGDVEEPTAPFGLIDVQRSGRDTREARLLLEPKLSVRLRECARRLKVSVASLFHLVWGQVIARTSGQRDVVFGTVLFGRMQGGVGSDRGMGLFINTLPIRVQLGQTPLVESVQELHLLLAELIRHEHATLALAQRCSRIAAPAPLFSCLLNYRHGRSVKQGTANSAQAQQGIEWLRSEERTNYPLTLSVDDLDDAFYLTAQVQEPVDPARICGYVWTALDELVEALDKTPLSPVERLEILPAAEREQVLYGWNDTSTEFPSELCIHQLFEEQVARTPEATAVLYDDRRLTYGELNERSNRLAHHLIGLGVGPDTRVAICVERGFEMIEALLAVLKAGGAYVPLDPSYPEDRLHFMLQDSGPLVLLTQGHLRKLFAALVVDIPVLELDDARPAWNGNSTENPILGQGLGSRNLAYIIYTSGSTGTPKGVMVEHRGVVNRIIWMQTQYKLEKSESVLQKTSFGFDVSVWEFFWPIISGAVLVMLAPNEHKDPALLANAVDHHKISIIHFVPSALSELIRHEIGAKLHCLRDLILSGESLSFELINQLRKELPSTRLHNLYGPTEASVDVTAWSIPQPLRYPIVPIGRPIFNTQIYILNPKGQPAPIGVVGELYIGGVQVARGYLNRPELTAERFVVDPFAKQPGARMYKTGDLGRWLSDGTIEYLGRNDFQVKIRGFRIELGEIEARLAEHPGVRDAVVIAREDTPGDKRLVAYYTSSADVSDNGAEAFRSHLSATLPDYMVPAAYVYLDALPLTPNGKLDRKALPAPEGDAYSTRSYEPPQGETETILAAVWADVLKLEQVGRHDNFFDLGGHSLLAVRVITRLRRSLNVEVSLNTLFAHPVLLDCARSIELISTAALPAITVQPRPEHLPLSFAQQRLWFLAQMEGVSRAYHVPFGLQLEGDLDYEALQQSLDAIMMRHESLRTSFRAMDGVPVQIISPAGRLSLQVHDLRSAEDADLQVKNLAELEAETVFDLEHGPVIRGRLIRQAEHRHILLITMHHIVSDGWSIGLLTRELGSLYGALHEGRAASLPALAVQYADYALWQRQWIDGEVLRSQAAFWQKNLEGAPALLELPSDHPRPSEQNYAGSTVRVVLEPKLTQGLKQLSQRHGTTLFMTLLAAWSVLLSRLSGQMDLVIGTPTANRNRAEIEELIGFFVNTLALRIDLSGSPTVAEMLERVKSQALSAQQHQDIPFEQVVELAKPVRSLSHSPLFQVMFAWQNAPRAALEMSGLQVRSASLSSHTVAKFDLTLSMFEVGDMIAGGLEYATALFERATIERFLTYFETLLTSMVADDQQRIERLEILPAAEREQVLYGWNDTSTEFPSELCIHQLFEEQVARTPEATAVLYDDRRLTYGELNERSNRLAHHLIGLGVGPDTRVAICVERGFEMIEALLAVLKAGGAYVPLDPSYPEDRLHFMLQDSGPLVLLTQGHLRKLFAALVVDIPVLELDDARPAWNGNSTENPILGQGLGSRNLAYIIYTSGSTGTPKGVMVEHRGVVRLVCNTNYVAFRTDDVVAQASNISFDAATFEIWGPLLHGASFLVVQKDSLLDALQFSPLLSQITVLWLTSGVFSQIASSLNTASPRYLIVGGEALDPRIVASFRNQMEVGQQRGALLNGYGPTETTTFAATYSIPFGFRSTENVPIGRPISNTQIYILDRSGSPVPVGVVGELHIGGAGVARGYLNRPELTAERFVVDPFAKQPGARMYKTGDLGRWLSDGTIEYLGRNDFQVKIRGFRIELGEIEARLAEHPGVRDAVVIAREDTPGDKRLVAYYTSSADVSDNGAEAFRSHLSATLPDYMVPAAYVYLDALPLTPNGKLDRKALPAPEGDAYSTRSYEPPQGETETILAAVWADVLKLEQVGRHDNFFDLGGHSLLAVRVITRLRALGLASSLECFFKNPTIETLSSRIVPNQTFSIDPNEAICIRKGNQHKPIFFAHCGGNQLLYALSLAPHIDAAIPLYGLPAPTSSCELSTVEGMATRLLKMIKNVDSSGPYNLVGWSFGGLLAYEIAVQLRGQGEEVSLLALLDTYCASNGRVPPARNEELSGFHRDLRYVLSEEFKKDSYRLRQLETINFTLYDLDSLVIELHAKDLLPASLSQSSADQIAQICRLARNYRLAEAEYWPTPLDRKIDLFIAEGSDCAAGWRSIVKRANLFEHTMNGNHRSMLQNNNTSTLGQSISNLFIDPRGRTGQVSSHRAELLPLSNATTGGGRAIICIPGAGANITSFLEFAESCDRDSTVYGLQITSLDDDAVPFTSVRSAATESLPAIMSLLSNHSSLHLIGHSFGGWIAVEIVHQLGAAGHQIKTLTLLDSTPPSKPESNIEFRNIDVLRSWIALIDTYLGANLGGEVGELEHIALHARLTKLRLAMTKAKLLPDKAHSAILNGPLRSFAAALRMSYDPENTLDIPTQFITVTPAKCQNISDVSIDARCNPVDWFLYVSALRVEFVTGNHLTMLNEPHVSLVKDLVLKHIDEWTD